MASRPTRPNVTAPPIAQRLPPAAQLFSPLVSDFAGYTAQQLGDLGTGTDGFDAIFGLAAGSIDPDVKGLSTFDDLLNTLAFNTGDFGKTYFTAVDGAIPGLLADGETLNYNVQNPGSVTGAPTIDPIPAPPSPGGGGIGGGGGSDGGNPNSGVGDLPIDLGPIPPPYPSSQNPDGGDPGGGDPGAGGGDPGGGIPSGWPGGGIGPGTGTGGGAIGGGGTGAGGGGCNEFDRAEGKC